MNGEQPAPIPVEKVGIPIPEDQVTPEMRMNAIGSPDRVGAGVLRTPEQTSAPESTEVLGDTVVGSMVEVDAPADTTDVVTEDGKTLTGDAAKYYRLVTGADQVGVENAAVRPEKSGENRIAQRVDQQMAIDRADRALRKEAGLPPRTFDLR